MKPAAVKQKRGARIVAGISAAVVLFTIVAPHVSPSWKPFEDAFVTLLFVALRMTGALAFFISLCFLDRRNGAKNR